MHEGVRAFAEARAPLDRAVARAPMRVVTWNVNSIGARLPRVLELLDSTRPTSSPAGNEVRGRSPDELRAALRGRRPRHQALGGVAILAGPTARRLRCHRGPARVGLPADEARWIEATVGPVRVAACT
jgi:exonuclease III